MRILLSGGGTGGHIYPVLAVIDALTSLRQPLPSTGLRTSERAQDKAQDAAGFETPQQGTSSTGLEPSASNSVELLWVGSHDGIEADLVPRAGVPFEGIAAAGLRGVLSPSTGSGRRLSKGGVAPLQLGRNLVLLIRGTLQAYRIIGRFQPDVIFVTGGYVSVPVVLAGRVRQVPIVIFLPDIVPGLAIRSLAQLAAVIAVSFEASRQYLPREKVVVTGYPVRPELYAAKQTEARQSLGLDPDLKTILIFGGSRGARRINWAVSAALEALLDPSTGPSSGPSTCLRAPHRQASSGRGSGRGSGGASGHRPAQLIHISGRLDIADMEQRRETLPATLRNRYHLFDYLHEEMIDALAAADLVVSRAGAATLGEFPAAGVPAVLVPYPYAGAHQAENAAVLAEAGGAIVVPDAELTGERLLNTVRGLLTDEERLAAMQASMSRLARPDAARQIAELIINCQL